MLPSVLAITVALFLITLSSALSLDSSVHIARHHHIARQSVVKRASVSARCQKRNSTAASSTTSSTLLAKATATPASSSSQAPPPSSSPSSGSGKVGIAWAYGGDDALKNFITDKVSAVYTWNPVKPPKTYGMQYAPMLWGLDQLTQFQNLVKPGYSNIVLAYNEPDLSSQANLDPETAARTWIANGQPLRNQGYSTIAPAVAFDSSWLSSFFDACKGCQWDGLAAHIYTTDAQDMINYLTTLHNTFNLPLWVTEFACQDFNGGPQCDENQVFSFMTTVTQWMDETEYIVKYFAYGVMTAAEININPLNALMNPDGTPNALGNLYLGN